MPKLISVSVVVMIIAALMSMTGRGGGNFYVPVLLASGLPTLQAATTGQCILFSTAVAASLVFHKSRTIDWKLALVIDPPTDVMALLGGYYAHLLPGGTLKFVFAGAIGVSGGSFKVPLMVLTCGVPMRVTVGTSAAMVAATAFMGLIGHWAAGDFNVAWAMPMSAAAVIGGLLGGAFSLKTRPENLKKIFAYTTLGAALFMVVNACLSAEG